MRYVVLAFALFAADAAAEEVTLTYTAVTHVRTAESEAILDNEAHRVGVATFRGLAIFDDGALAVHRYEGGFDLIDSVGPFFGYVLWQFDDGSELRAAYSGRASDWSSESVHVEATFRDFSGTGRFEGALGEGRFEGRRLDAIEHGGSTLLEGTLKLTLGER